MAANGCTRAVTGIIILTALSGCASWNARWGAFLQACADERALKLEEAQDRLEVLKAELEVERKAIREERQLDLAALRAENEKRECQNKSQFEESVRTKIGLDVDHKLELGQLQVNVDELKKLIEQNDRELRRQEEALRQMPPPAPYCCPSCGAPAPKCACQQPGMEPLNQSDCAGTYPFGQQPLRQAQRKPILPTEIPLMLPVRMKMAVQGPRLEESKVRLSPRPGRQSLRSLREKKPCCPCQQCIQGMPCGVCPPACEAPGRPADSDSLFGIETSYDRMASRGLREPEPVPPGGDQGVEAQKEADEQGMP